MLSEFQNWTFFLAHLIQRIMWAFRHSNYLTNWDKTLEEWCLEEHLAKFLIFFWLTKSMVDTFLIGQYTQKIVTSETIVPIVTKFGRNVQWMGPLHRLYFYRGTSKRHKGVKKGVLLKIFCGERSFFNQFWCRRGIKTLLKDQWWKCSCICYGTVMWYEDPILCISEFIIYNLIQ